MRITKIKKRLLKIGILFLGILLTFTNCEKEDIIQDNFSLEKLNQKNDPKINNFQQNFSLKNFQDNFIKENLKVKWDQHDSYIDANNSLIYEFETNLNSKISPLKEGKSFYSKYKVQGSIDNRGNISYKILKYLSNEKKCLKSIYVNELNIFSGSITYFNNKGDILKLEGYKNGAFIEEFDISTTNNVSAKEAPIVNNGTWVPILTERWTDWYQNIQGGSLMFYTHSYNSSVTVEWIYIDIGGSGYSNTTYHSHTDAPHGTGTYPDPDFVDNHVEEILIDSTFQNIDKINCTLIQLLKTKTIKKLLDDFFGSDADYDLIFKVEGNLSCNGNTSVAGCTTSNYDYNDNKVVISIDSDYINNPETPTLYLARTILYEAIHANLFLAVKKLNGGTTPSSNDFDVLFEEYGQLKNQHEIMADRYRNLIVQGLKDVHSLLGDQSFIDYYNSNTLWDWDKFYDELSWVGLLDTAKGQEHVQTPNYNIDASFYFDGAKVNSTKNPKCD